MSEKILWKGSPSQMLNLGTYLLGLLVATGIGILGAVIAMPLKIGIEPKQPGKNEIPRHQIKS